MSDEKVPVDNAATRQWAVKREKFLVALRTCGRVTVAAQKAGIKDPTQLYRWRREHEDFAIAWDEAKEMSNDVLEDAAWGRAVEGVDKPVLYKGEIVAYEKEYDTALTTLLLRANRPGKFRESVSAGITINHTVGVAILPMTARKLEDWERSALECMGQQHLLVPPSPVVIEQDGTPVRQALVRK